MAAGARDSRAVADRITEAREAKGISRQGLADAAGVPRETLRRKLEQAPDDLKLGEVFRIADVLEQPFEFLAWGITAEVTA